MEHRGSEEMATLRGNPKQLLTRSEILSARRVKAHNAVEEPMNAPTSSATASHPLESDVAVEISKLVEESVPRRAPDLESDVERIRSSVARLASNSIEGLGALTSELQDLQRFLNSEVERVQNEIESALAGIRIIMDTIGPWKSSPAALTPPANARIARTASTRSLG
jgi:hypothetical protein